MIRDFKQSDCKALYPIYKEYVLHTDISFELKPMEYEDFCSHMIHTAENHPFLIAEHEGEVIGYATVHPAFQREAYRFCMELSIYFRPGPHYQMADPLLEGLEKACKERNIRWMVACITDTNTVSINFHARHGYRYAGALPECGYKFEAWHGVVWLVKDLTQAQEAYISKDAVVLGDVTIGKESSVWPKAVIRADLEPVVIGDQTNVQDGCILHASKGYPCTVKNRVTIGHGAIVHGCTIEDDVLIGMGAIVMDGAVVESRCVIGAGTLIPQGKRIPAGSIVIGNPYRIVSQVGEKHEQMIADAAQEYVELAKHSL